MSDFEIPAERDLPDGRQEVRARHLVRELSTTRRRRRVVLTLVPALIVLLTVATGFTAYTLLRKEPTQMESIGCFDRASLSANITIVETDGRSPVAQCGDLWREGAVESAVPAQLAACVLSSGAIGVFPSVDDRTCERMGLADLSPQGEAERRRFVRMRNAVYASIGTPASGKSRGSSHCVGEQRLARSCGARSMLMGAQTGGSRLGASRFLRSARAPTSRSTVTATRHCYLQPRGTEGLASRCAATPDTRV